MAIILAVSVVMFVSLLGASYAWYVANNVVTDIGVKTVGADKIKTEFVVSDYIMNSVGIPILDANVATEADKNLFTIMASESMTLNAKYTIYLDNIVIDDALKISDFKWDLLKSDVSVANGDFSTIGNNTRLNLYTTNLVLNATSPDSYELRVWLRDTGSVQNDLMGKSFSARIKVDVYLANN